MIYFIYGEDSYRSKQKLEEIVEEYKKVHKSGLNLIYIDVGKETPFDEFYGNLKSVSMFAEKKLIILKDIFSAQGGPVSGWQEDFLDKIKIINETKDIIIIYENKLPDKRTKIFKALQKNGKCQEFDTLKGVYLERWIRAKFEKNKAKIDDDALRFLSAQSSNNLWEITNEINKLSNYKSGSIIKKEDVELMIRPAVENDIFKTIEALAAKDKKQALSLVYKHLGKGDNPLYLLSMISYQFKNLLILKELQDARVPYGEMVKKSGLHPFVVQKTSYLCGRFLMKDLKKIYLKIFQIDSDIKTGKIEAEMALDLFIAGI